MCVRDVDNIEVYGMPNKDRHRFIQETCYEKTLYIMDFAAPLPLQRAEGGDPAHPQ